MMGSAGLELGALPLAEAAPEVRFEQESALQPPLPPDIPTAGDADEVRVQRKMANPTAAATAGPATPNARRVAAAAEAQMQSPIQPSGSRAIRSVAPAPSRTRSMSNRAKQLGASSSGAGAPDLADAQGVPVSPSTPPPIVSPASSTGGIHPEALSVGDSQTGNASRPFGPAAGHTRSIRQARPIDSTRLDPSPQALAARSEPTPEDASVSTAEAGEGPRVVIGRINVEVVPPSATPPSTAAPRPGPLTAASVSVIGPLGGGIRPSLRLSLRHR
jgi:hypothetical protein